MMSAPQLSDFLGGYQRGIEVAVAGSATDELLGIREAFRRYFHDGLGRPVPVAVVPQEEGRRLRGIAGSDSEALRAAEGAAASLAARLGATYQFYVACEAAIQPLEARSKGRYFLRNWTVVQGPPGSACGASGSLELPERLISGVAPADFVTALPGTRRSGGMLAALTGGLESRRSAITLSTLNALASLFYGILEPKPGAH
jgi:non-canonical (house-cleaning) NTP pyrophosphatase